MIGITNATSSFGDWYGECRSTPSTIAKSVTVQDGFKLKSGATVTVLFSYNNTATNPTLNVNGTGAYPMTYQTSGNVDSKGWVRGEAVQFVFMNEWVLMKPIASENVYGEVTLLDTPSEALDAVSGYAATPKAVQEAINSMQIWQGTCKSPNAEQNKTVDVGNGFVLKDGAKIRVYFQGNSISNFTLNVNNTGDIDVIPADGGELYAGFVNQGYYNFTYTETKWGASGAVFPAWILDNTQIGGINTYGAVRAVDAPNPNFAASRGIVVSPKALSAVDNKATANTQWYGECTDAVDVVDRTVNVGAGFVRKDGVSVRVFMTNTNAIGATLNVNGTGKDEISQTAGGNPLNYTGAWKSNSIVEFTYNEYNAQWIMVNRGVALPNALGLVMSSNGKATLQQTSNPNYMVARANDIATAFDTLVTTQNFEGNVFTLTAANWSTDNTYNLEVLYPSSKYNLQISISSTATAEQYEAYNAAGIVGDNSTNVLTARNGKPTIDIPVKIQMFVKNWGDM